MKVLCSSSQPVPLSSRCTCCFYSARYILKSNCIYFCIWMDAGASRCKLCEGDSLAVITCISEPSMREASRWEQPSIICLASTVFTAWPQKQPSCLALEGKTPTFRVFVDLSLLSRINVMQSQVGIDADCIQLWFGVWSYIQLHKLYQRQLNCPRFICVCAESQWEVSFLTWEMRVKQIQPLLTW